MNAEYARNRTDSAQIFPLRRLTSSYENDKNSFNHLINSQSLFTYRYANIIYYKVRNTMQDVRHYRMILQSKSLDYVRKCTSSNVNKNGVMEKQKKYGWWNFQSSLCKVYQSSGINDTPSTTYNPKCTSTVGVAFLRWSWRQPQITVTNFWRVFFKGKTRRKFRLLVKLPREKHEKRISNVNRMNCCICGGTLGTIVSSATLFELMAQNATVYAGLVTSRQTTSFWKNRRKWDNLLPSREVTQNK